MGRATQDQEMHSKALEQAVLSPPEDKAGKSPPTQGYRISYFKTRNKIKYLRSNC